MITAENITDQQVIDLLRELTRDVETVRFALINDYAITETLRAEIKKARARCAAILNARAADAAEGGRE